MNSHCKNLRSIVKAIDIVDVVGARKKKNEKKEKRGGEWKKYMMQATNEYNKWFCLNLVGILIVQKDFE